MSNTFYWFDYETTGIDTARDRPLQFAGVRTDMDLNPVGEPLSVYCRLSEDILPHPESCLITGITPQLALERGVAEAEFARRVHVELSQTGTCAAGYNSIRFDDEVTRYLLYRNFYDPYEREYKNGNSRWDIIDMVRMCYALRPEGIEWPKHEDGSPSFKLEHLSQANCIKHEAAHDALSDVYATLGMARLVKERQPRLYEYLFNLRQKQEVAKLLNVRERQALLHTSSMFPSASGCTTVVLPLALHPTNRNGIVVYDLRHPPDDLLSLNAEQLRERIFTRTEELPEGVERVHLKTVHINKSPALAPLGTLTEAAAERIAIDLGKIKVHMDQLRNVNLDRKIHDALMQEHTGGGMDPELNLYGGFFGDGDRARMQAIREAAPQELATRHFAFDDARLPELLFRYRARNFPETLAAEEWRRWQQYRRERLTNPEAGGSITLQEFNRRLQDLGSNPELDERAMQILEDLAEYASMLESFD
ncbi:MAG TPA: exodeoxyribonuclease I [Gammaproteobacteria bacterium]|nr:exodeoxyribonuclease I [Gammaproteobacteria bacterium]